MTLDDISKLSDDELRVKVAELVGWQVHHGGKYCSIKGDCSSPLFRVLFNPLEDLNAMAEARKTLNQSERDIYSKILYFAIPHSYIAPQYEGEIQWDEYYEIVDADARSHAIAFIATKEGVR